MDAETKEERRARLIQQVDGDSRLNWIERWSQQAQQEQPWKWFLATPFMRHEERFALLVVAAAEGLQGDEDSVERLLADVARLWLVRFHRERQRQQQACELLEVEWPDDTGELTFGPRDGDPRLTLHWFDTVVLDARAKAREVQLRGRRRGPFLPWWWPDDVEALASPTSWRGGSPEAQPVVFLPGYVGVDLLGLRPEGIVGGFVAEPEAVVRAWARLGFRDLLGRPLRPGDGTPPEAWDDVPAEVELLDEVVERRRPPAPAELPPSRLALREAVRSSPSGSGAFFEWETP